MTENGETSAETPADLFRTALLHMLRPLTRAMIANGVTVGEATETLKHALVMAANDMAGEDEKRLSDSKISLKTGLHRKDVKRLRAQNPERPRRPKVNAATLTIGVWTTAEAYVDTKGKPKVLSREAFNELVRAARIDLPPATILTELMAQGAVTQDEDGHLSLTTRSFIGKDASASKLAAFEKNIVAHLETATDNLINDAGHYERAGHFNQLSDASISELEAETRAAFQEALERIAAKALKLQDIDAENANSANGKFAAGAFVLAAKGKSS